MTAVELPVVPVRDGIQVAGTTTRMVVTGLIWRTYGSLLKRIQRRTYLSTLCVSRSRLQGWAKLNPAADLQILHSTHPVQRGITEYVPETFLWH